MADNEYTNRNSDELSKVTKGLLRLGAGITELTIVFPRLVGQVEAAAGALAQSNRISYQGINQFTNQVKDSSITFADNIKNYSNLVSQGLGREAIELGSLNETMSLFGLNVAAGNRLVRLNTQALGLSTSQAENLARATIDSAIEYGIGVDAMVNALNQMSSALIQVGVEFGKDAAVGLEDATTKLIGMVGQEFGGTVTKFASQLFTGLDGLQRRAFLGIQGQELTTDTLIKALGRVAQLQTQAGGTGTGVTAVVEAIQQQFGFGADIFALADAISNPRQKDPVQTEQLEMQRKANDALIQLNQVFNKVLVSVTPFIVATSRLLAKTVDYIAPILKGVLLIKAAQLAQQAVLTARHGSQKAIEAIKVKLLTKIAMKSGSPWGGLSAASLPGVAGRLLSAAFPLLGAVTAILALPSILGLNSEKEQEIAKAQVEEQKKTNSLLTEEVMKRTQTDALLALKEQSAAMLLRLDSISESSRRAMEDGTRRTRTSEEALDFAKTNGVQGMSFLLPSNQQE